MVSIKKLTHKFSVDTSISYPEWEVPQGEHCLLIGGSGSGKTTLLHLMAGLLQIQTGEVTIAHQGLKNLSAAQLDVFRGKYIGLVFQQPHLVGVLSVQDNLKLAQYLANESQSSTRITEVLESLNIAEKRTAKIYELSQGQQQRVAIARALLNKPKIILADEPTASLDDTNATSVMDILIDQAALHKATLIIATHDSRVKQRVTSQLVL